MNEFIDPQLNSTNRQPVYLKASTNAACLHNQLVFYIIWSWRKWIIMHTGTVQRPITFSDWIMSIHNSRTAARVLDHTCYVINLKKSFDSICMKRYKVWFILVFETLEDFFPWSLYDSIALTFHPVLWIPAQC